MRTAIDQLRNKNNYTSETFQDWEKRSHRREPELFGAALELIEYIHTSSNSNLPKKKFSIALENGRAELSYSISQTSIDEYRSLLAKLSKGRDALPLTNDDHRILNHCRTLGTAENHPGCLKWHFQYDPNCDQGLLHDVVVDSKQSTQLDLLNNAINIMSEYAHFPEDMLADMLIEISAAHAEQEKCMRNLTKDICVHNVKLVKALQSARSDLHSPVNTMVIKWIEKLKSEAHFHEALMWSLYFSPNAAQAANVYENAIAILFAWREYEEGNIDTISLNLPNGLTLSYKEALFKFAWKKEAVTHDASDIDIASSMLSEIADGTGIMHAYSANSDEADKHIERARANYQLRVENQKLTARVRELEAQAAVKEPKVTQQNSGTSVSSAILFWNAKAKAQPASQSSVHRLNNGSKMG